MTKELTMEKTSLASKWELKKLGEVCSFQGGSQPPKSQFIYEKRNGYVRFLQIRDFKSDKNITYIPESPKNRYCSDDDILLGRYGASVGKVLINKTGAYNVAVMKTIPDEKVLFKRYLFFYFTSKDFQNRLEIVSSRSAQNGFSKSDIFDFPILVPTLSQQKQIVAILDKSFAAIDTAKANAEQNLQNAKELFESTKKNVFDNLEGISNKVELPYVCDNIFAGGDVPKGHYSKTITDEYQIPIIANAVKDNGLYGFTNKVRVSKASITIAARGSGTGHTEIRNKPFFPIVRLIVLTPNSELIKLEFLKYSIQNLDILRSGSAIPQLTVPMIKGYLILLPKLEEQEQIVRKLNSLSIETKKLEAIYKQKIADLEEMKKSVLQKAFSGQLKTIN